MTAVTSFGPIFPADPSMRRVEMRLPVAKVLARAVLWIADWLISFF